MNKKILTIAFLLMITSLSAIARKPAVEPISSMEPKSYNVTTPGVEVEFNFGNHIFANQQSIGNRLQTTPQWIPAIDLISFTLLPFLMWFFINRQTNKLESKIEDEAHTPYADSINQENVASLSDHRSGTNKNSKEKTDKKKVA